MTEDKTVKERLEFIKRDVAEIITEEELEALLKAKKHPTVYLGTAITGRPHVGYFVWVLKLLDFLKAGFKVKLLLADLHGALDNTPWDLLEKRYEYYQKVISGMFTALGADLGNVEFVKGSSFQLSPEYQSDMLQLATMTSVHDANKASSEVVKQEENPKLAGLLYPLMQALDEHYLDADVQYGGIDQRKILVFAREANSKLGRKPRVEVMTPLIPGFQGPEAKMSASIEHSKIDLLDDEKTISKKLKKAYCPEGEAEGNGVLAFAKHVIFPVLESDSRKLLIERPEKYGGNLEFKKYAKLETAFVSGELHPLDLKKAVAAEIDKLTKAIREEMKTEKDLINSAYPDG